MEQRVGASKRPVAGPQAISARWRIGIILWMMLVAVFLYLGFRWNHLRYRQSALHYLLARHAKLEFVARPTSAWSDLLRRTGIGSPFELRSIDLNGSFATDADLAQIAAFEELSTLRLRQAFLSRRGAAQLSTLQQLTALDLAGAHFDDATLAALPGDALRFLDVSETAIGESGVDAISRWRQLSTLRVRGVGVSDAALAKLARLPRLLELDLSCTQASSETAEALRSHPRLRFLFLEQCPIADPEMEAIAECPSLEWLSIEGTDVGDVGISRLASCERLMRLLLRATRATDRSLQALRPLQQLTEIDAAQTDITLAGLAQFQRRFDKTRQKVPTPERPTGGSNGGEPWQR